MKISDLDTPAVLIDVEVMERNLRRMSDYCSTHALKLRPHTKTHKIPALAHSQLKLGAAGITVAKLGEAEVMTDGGINDILIVYPLLGEGKLDRLVKLAERVKCAVSIDSLEVAQGISRAALSAGVTVGVRAEFDTGFARCGLPITEHSAETAQRIRELPNLRWEGVLTYPGHIMGTAAEREILLARENAKLSALKELLDSRGIDCAIVSGGNTPAAYISHRFRNVNEIRPGTYIFNDKNTVCAEAATNSDCAATVLATVVSVSVAGKAMIDAGSKTLSADPLLSGLRLGYGEVLNYPDVTLEDLSEEHGHLNLQRTSTSPKLGERLRIVPNHICTCINLHDRVYGCSGEDVIVQWEVQGRGKTQ
jgi:D-serine deaminase-like pyridoxal phosphate-dependent protein